MVQVPAALNEATPFATAQGPVVAKLNGRFDVVEATSVSGVPTVWPPGLANEIVCGLSTAKLCITGVAAT